MIAPAVLSHLGVQHPDTWAAPLVAACQACAITTPRRQAGFLANIIHESARLARLIESLDYSPAGLIATWPSRFTVGLAASMGRTVQRSANQHAIAEHVYGGRMGNGPEGSGDGWLYRGRGLLQITGKANYAAEAKLAGLSLAEMPAYLGSPAGAAMSAARFWQRAGCNAKMDAGDMRGARVLVNGGNVGMADVLALYPVALAALGGQPAAPVTPADTETADETERLNAWSRARG